MDSSFEKVREFELVLDGELNKLSILRSSPARAIENTAGLVSLAFSTKGNPRAAVAQGARFSEAFEVALPFLIESDHDGEIDPTVLIQDLEFLGHYYSLREFLYYTYNSLGSISWRFESEKLKIEYSDRSIPHQFIHNWNRRLRHLFDLHQSSQARTDALHKLLRGKDEFGDADHIQAAFEAIADEARERMRINFDILGGERSTVSFPRYTYAQFYRIYKHLLSKMLYHRHYAEANDTWPTFIFSTEGLVQEITIAVDIEPRLVNSVLEDMTYTRENRRIPSAYFPIVKHGRVDSFIIPPERFISDDGLAQFLRVHATKNPRWFTSEISNTMGDNFVDILAAEAVDAGFGAIKKLDLDMFDRSAPDVDLLIWSREPTLGYFVFLIEAKATVPALWSKDYLRVLAQDSLSKAFSQVDRIRRLLTREEVGRYVIDRVLQADPDPLPNGIVGIRQLIVSSQNAGMFFQGHEVQVLDYLTLTRLLQSSDGDVVYLLDMLKRLLAGTKYESHPVSVRVGRYDVTYEGIEFVKPDIFPMHAWKSQGLDVNATEEFFAAGGELFHPDMHSDFREGLPVRRKEVD